MLDELLARCAFPPAGTPVVLRLLGRRRLHRAAGAGRPRPGSSSTAVHVDHGLRPTSGDEAAQAVAIAARLGVPVRVVRVDLEPGPNLQARAREARRAVLPPGALTGHTADDRAETMLINLLRGAGPDGLAAIGPAPARPLLALRRAETRALCAELGLAHGRRSVERRPAVPAQPGPSRAGPAARRHRRTRRRRAPHPHRRAGPRGARAGRRTGRRPGPHRRQGPGGGADHARQPGHPPLAHRSTATRPTRRRWPASWPSPAARHAPASSPAGGGSNDTVSGCASSTPPQ